MRDQYAYKITGSTTSALVCLTGTVGRLLESNRYVRCIMIDFYKAFDTVNHAFLLKQELSYRKQIAHQLCTQYGEGIYDNLVTLKSRLTVTQRHWKRNH